MLNKAELTAVTRIIEDRYRHKYVITKKHYVELVHKSSNWNLPKDGKIFMSPFMFEKLLSYVSEALGFMFEAQGLEPKEELHTEQ